MKKFMVKLRLNLRITKWLIEYLAGAFWYLALPWIWIKIKSIHTSPVFSGVIVFVLAFLYFSFMGNQEIFPSIWKGFVVGCIIAYLHFAILLIFAGIQNRASKRIEEDMYKR